MKRKRAVRLLGLLVACVVLYLAWWGRQFYVRPGLVMDHRIPPEAEEVILEWYEETGGAPPVRLNFRNIRDAIGSPAGSDAGKAGAILESKTEIRVVHDGREWWFVERDGSWVLDPGRP